MNDLISKNEQKLYLGGYGGYGDYGSDPIKCKVYGSGCHHSPQLGTTTCTAGISESKCKELCEEANAVLYNQEVICCVCGISF